MVDHDRTLAGTASVIIDSGSAASGGRHLSFTTDGVAALAPAIEVEVSGEHRSWSGSFFGGQDHLTRVIDGPEVDSLVVVAAGVAYLVPVEDPDRFEVLSLRPVRDAVCSETTRVVVLVGYTSLLGVGPGDLRWKTDRLVSDGFTEVRLTVDSVVVRGFHAPSDAEVEIAVDLSTGEILSRI